MRNTVNIYIGMEYLLSHLPFQSQDFSSVCCTIFMKLVWKTLVLDQRVIL